MGTARIFTAGLGEDHAWTANATSCLGGPLTAMARYAEAEPMLLESHEVLAATDDQAAWAEAARGRIVALYAAWGKPAEAARWRSAH